MKIIALSRQIGSYGDEIAEMTARKLNYQVMGPEQIHDLAESCDEAFKKACSLYEREVPKNMWERFFFDHPAYTSLFESLTYELASRGDVILLGRGSQIVLLNIRGVMRTRVVAPTETRIERLMNQQGLSANEARELVRRHGHRRRALIEGIYHHDLSDWALYDLIVNTQDMTAEEGAYIITQAAEGMQPVADEENLKKWLKGMALAKQVESALRKQITAAAFSSITVTAEQPGRVTLTGAVADEKDKEKAEKIARGFDEVTEVDNQIKASRLFGAI